MAGWGAGNLGGDWRVLYDRSGGTAQDEGELMSRHFAIEATLAGAILLFPVLLNAQQRSPRSAVGVAQVVAPARPMAVAAPTQVAHIPTHAAPVPHAASHSGAIGARPVTPRSTGRPAGVKSTVLSHSVRSAPGATSGTAFVQSGSENDGNSAPGLGFDYAHFAAVHPNSGREHFRGGSVVPFVGGGIFVPAVGYMEPGAIAESAAQEEQTGNDEAPESAEVAPVEPAPVAATRARAKSNSAAVATPEYIFVRRDGTVFFAVAYSWLNGNLQYVTQDGFRKLAPLGTLDLDATTQFNEQRGLSFRSPA